MNSELIGTISQKLQQISQKSMMERKKEQKEAELEHEALQEAIAEKKSREGAELELARDKVAKLSSYLDETVRAMSIQTNK